MQTAIFHSVNSGIYIWNGSYGVLIDGLHHGSQVGFSETPPEICRQLSKHDGLFAHLDGILFTHLHPDHFDRQKLQTAIQVPRPPQVFGPNLPESTAAVRKIFADTWLFRVGDIHVLSVETPHDGKQYREVNHRSFLLHTSQESIFVAGDAILEEERADMLKGFFNKPISAAFINVFQVFSKSGRAFLRRLQPQRIFLYHLPMPKDDKLNCISLAHNAQKQFPVDLPPLEIPEHLQWIDNHPAEWYRPVNQSKILFMPSPKETISAVAVPGSF